MTNQRRVIFTGDIAAWNGRAAPNIIVSLGAVDRPRADYDGIGDGEIHYALRMTARSVTIDEYYDDTFVAHRIDL